MMKYVLLCSNHTCFCQKDDMAFYHLLVYLVNKGFYGEMDHMNCSFEIIVL
jgi:hypothetical protein